MWVTTNDKSSRKQFVVRLKPWQQGMDVCNITPSWGQSWHSGVLNSKYNCQNEAILLWPIWLTHDCDPDSSRHTVAILHVRWSILDIITHKIQQGNTLFSRLVHEPWTSIGNTAEGLFLDENDADAPLLSNPPSLSTKPSDFAPQGASTTPHTVRSALMLIAHSCYAMHCCYHMLMLQFCQLANRNEWIRVCKRASTSEV